MLEELQLIKAQTPEQNMFQGDRLMRSARRDRERLHRRLSQLSGGAR